MIYRTEPEEPKRNNNAPKYKPAKQKKGRRGFNSTPIIIIAIVILIFAVAGLGIKYYQSDINGDRGSGKEISIEVEQGSSTEKIADLLKDAGVIKSAKLFRIYSRFISMSDGTYQYGTHSLNDSMSYLEIIDVLQRSDMPYRESFTVTFPEGSTALKMALEFESLGFCTVDEFVNCCNNDTFDLEVMSYISDTDDKFIRLDGFLYPDTYEFYIDATVHDVVEQMLRTFQNKVMTDDIMAQVNESGLTLEENIILASIVQKEALGEDVYGMVSSVFHNRLNSDDFPNLQSDTSAECQLGNFIYGVMGLYYNGDIDPYVRNIPSNKVWAYDTYTHEGLIVGAICNPGMKAIMSTLEPEETDYYFFITDDNHKFYWATTDYEHTLNIAEVRRVNSQG